MHNRASLSFSLSLLIEMQWFELPLISRITPTYHTSHWNLYFPPQLRIKDSFPILFHYFRFCFAFKLVRALNAIFFWRSSLAACLWFSFHEAKETCKYLLRYRLLSVYVDMPVQFTGTSVIVFLFFVLRCVRSFVLSTEFLLWKSRLQWFIYVPAFTFVLMQS